MLDWPLLNDHDSTSSTRLNEYGFVERVHRRRLHKKYHNASYVCKLGHKISGGISFGQMGKNLRRLIYLITIFGKKTNNNIPLKALYTRGLQP